MISQLRIVPGARSTNTERHLPNHLPATLLLGLAQRAMGDTASAESRMRSICWPAAALRQIEQLLELARIGEYSKSIDLYADLLTSYPRPAEIWMSYGHALGKVLSVYPVARGVLNMPTCDLHSPRGFD